MENTRRTRREKELLSKRGHRPQTSPLVMDELKRLRDLRRQEKDDEQRQALGEQHAKIKAEFDQWTDNLCEVIKTKAQIEVQPDGKVHYTLPTEIVQLVWALTIAREDLREKLFMQLLRRKTQEAKAVKEAEARKVREAEERAAAELAASDAVEAAAEEQPDVHVSDAQEQPDAGA